MVSLELVSAAASNPSGDSLRLLAESVDPVDEKAIGAEVAAARAAGHSSGELALLLDTIIGLIDLTTLEGTDTPARVAALARRALHPDQDDPSAPHTAAVCVYGDLARSARDVLGQDSPVRLACVAGAFPSGRAHIDVKLADVRYALSQGATEIDMVIDRGAFLSGDYTKVFDDVYRIVQEGHRAPTPATVKVILENGELGGTTEVAKASWIAMAAGADMIKTSTGKVPSAATPEDVAVMVHAAKRYEELTGRAVGVKAAGGIRTAASALQYVDLVATIAGARWLTPARFRFGASGVLSDIVLARHALAAGNDPFAGHGTAASAQY